jgi:hypothetical protein
LEGATAATSGLTAKSGRGYTAPAPDAAILSAARRVFVMNAHAEIGPRLFESK